MTAHEIRESFLAYFAARGHEIVPSSSLVPDDDPTLLFTNAGMNQFKDVFLGKVTRASRRATTAQKCMRVSGKHNDLDNVGPSPTHHTFFEMLGNFSFGDYFKAGAIPFAWTLLTEVWQLEPDRLFPTIFKGEAGIARDVDAYDLWRGLVPASRITELGLSENFWQMGDTGPCGRCSEILYFRGDDFPCSEPTCRGIECSCGRYVEIWNNVFMEFNRDAAGALTPLPAPSIDTGMGLERVTAVIQGARSNYDTDVFTPILRAIALRAGRPYTQNATDGDHPDVSMRVVADHLRAMTFLIADGVQPSNEWRGYVLRKIMRRAMRHGKKLGFAAPFLHTLVDVVVADMGGAYPELGREAAAIRRTVLAEEERFDSVLTSGLPRIEALLERTVRSGQAMVSGVEVFHLYDSLGVPFDFVEDLAGQRGLTIDRTAYDRAMDQQRGRARAAGNFEAKKATGFSYASDGERHRIEAIPDRFEGYDHTETDHAEILALFDHDRQQAAELAAGSDGYAIFDRSPFYVESGGQVSDVGQVLRAGVVVADVTGMARIVAGGARVHRVETDGPLAIGDRHTLQVDRVRRDAIRRNHTGTHLLHAVLRRQLGTHVRQAGSLVAPDRLRFDFTHPSPVPPDDRLAIERAVNEAVYRNFVVSTEVQATDQAMQSGAMALFGEKYGDRVRVVSVGPRTEPFSIELCGGTHVARTGDIGPFVIVEEAGVAAGVRRIEALTGEAAVARTQTTQTTLDATVAALGVPPTDASEAVLRLQAENKRLARENADLKVKAALGGGTAPGEAGDTLAIGERRLVTRRVSGLDKESLRRLSDSIRDRVAEGVVVLVGEHEGRVQLLVTVTKGLTSQVNAGALVKELAPLVGGGGGGRPDFAEAGGKDASRIGDLLDKARALVTSALTP